MPVIKLEQKCSSLSLRALSTISEKDLHHFEYEIRHPLGIYKNSIREIANHFNRTFNDLEALRKEYVEKNTTTTFKSLLESQKDLLYRLREFIDDCYLILQGLSPLDGKHYPKTMFSNQYLRKIKYPGFKSFERNIARYKNDHVGAIVNAMKHKHRKLRGIFIYSKRDRSTFIPGYYVEGTSKKGMLAPCRSVHPDENSAFTFNRDLKLHIWNFFAIDKALFDAVNAAKQAWDIAESKAENDNDNIDLSSIVEQALNLPHQFYEDEQQKPTVRIQPAICGYELEYPFWKGIEVLPDDLRITSMPVVDMTVPSIALPYFKRNA